MTYGEQISCITSDALKHGVPPQEIILNLELLSHELKNSLLAQAMAAAEGAQSPLIVPADGRVT
jgi:hypothetical protein